ncbi:acetyl-CoA synthetase-like protein [Dentipellis sp. KUC8613]|nr:acetyl-CoA synthetase-like protein [Dentipellis sp. KUC8613]
MSQEQQSQPVWTPKRTFAECRAILTAPGMPFELEEKLVHGRLLTVYKHMEPNLRSYFLKFTTAYAQREYIVYERERYTYAQVRAQAEQLADTFWETYGVRKGDRAAIITRNIPEAILAFWALALLGAVPTFVNAWQRPDGLAHCIRLTAPKLLVLDAERAAVLLPQLPTLLADLRLAGVVVARHEGPFPASWAAPASAPVRTWASLFAGEQGISKGTWKTAPAAHPDDPAAILFTSGTTARPRAVLTSQRAFLSNTYSGVYLGLLSRLRDGHGLPAPGSAPPPATGFLMTAPLFHVAGIATNVMTNMFRGNKIVLLRKWDVEQAARLSVAENVTETSAVPALLLDMLRSRAFAGRIGLLGATSAAAPMPPHMKRDFGQAFPRAALIHVYGLTETSAIVTATVGGDYLLRPTTAGRPPPVTQVAIVDPETLTVLPPDRVGEIWVRGANVMTCYYNDPQATDAAVTRDGWFRTGDLGALDADGFLYIKDRLKDMIIRGGENIHSTQIENALYADARVLEAAAVGVPDARLGELPAAVVRVAGGVGVREAELVEGAAERLPKYAVPVMVVVVEDALERNAAGKVDKQALRRVAREEWERRGRVGVEKTKGKL